MFRIISKRNRYQNPWYSISGEEAVHSVTGSHIHYDVVRYKNPVVVALVKHGGNVLVEEIERYPINALSLELPAGGMEAGETPEAAAAREVLEETGITIRNAKCVYRFYSNDGGSDQLVHVVGRVCFGGYRRADQRAARRVLDGGRNPAKEDHGQHHEGWRVDYRRAAVFIGGQRCRGGSGMNCSIRVI